MQKTNKMLEIKAEVPQNGKINKVMGKEQNGKLSGLNRLPIRMEVKPLSINQCWQGRRFKTDAYKKYEAVLLMTLPKMDLPEPPYQIYFKFGFSSASSDYDNCIKGTQDILSKKYKFNDKLIKRAVIDIESVKKGSEFFEFKIDNLKQ